MVEACTFVRQPRFLHNKHTILQIIHQRRQVDGYTCPAARVPSDGCTIFLSSNRQLCEYYWMVTSICMQCMTIFFAVAHVAESHRVTSR